MKLQTKFQKQEVIRILNEEINTFPSFPNSVFSFIRGTSIVLGKIENNSFKLRNRMNPFFSVRAVGEIKEMESGSQINIEFKYPPTLFSLLIFYKEEIDVEKIVCFLKDKLEAKEAA